MNIIKKSLERALKSDYSKWSSTEMAVSSNNNFVRDLKIRAKTTQIFYEKQSMIEGPHNNIG